MGEGTLRSSVLLNGLGLVAVVVNLLHVPGVDDVEGGGQDGLGLDRGAVGLDDYVVVVVAGWLAQPCCL